MIILNNRPVYVGNFKPIVIDGSEPGPTPVNPFPSDMDFVYLANDFDGTKIPNVVPNSTFGDYLQSGTLVKNGSGSSCYLTKSSGFLYKDLTSAELDNIKAINSTYTFFIRMMQDSNSSVGGIMSCRYNGGYIYMIRCNNKQLQIHTNIGRDLGSDFSLAVDRVYKVQISGSTFYAKNLETNVDYTLTYSTNRSMGTRMTSFTAWSGVGDEDALDKFYAFAGIPRATTAEEDEQIKKYLLSQGV